MRKKKLLLTLLLTVAVIMSACSTSNTGVGGNMSALVLEKIGIKYYGGETIQDKYLRPVKGKGTGTDHTVTGQSKVYYFIPENSNKTPVVMLPGMALSSDIYITTPDGRNGWVYDFAAKGYPVYVVEPPKHAPAALDTRIYNGVWKGEKQPDSQPEMFKWSNEIAYKSFGIGSEPGNPYEGTRFPVDDAYQMYASLPVAIGSSMPSDEEVRNTIEILEDTGPAVIVAHSLGGVLAVMVAQERPELVKGMVMVEAMEGFGKGGINEQSVESTFKNIAYLGILGADLSNRGMNSRLTAANKSSQLIKNAGGKGHVIDLEAEGIDGNTHMLMQDNNSSEIAKMITDWLDNNLK